MTLNKKDLLLYAVTDRHWTGRQSLVEQVQDSLDGGVTMVQLREKTLSYKDFMEEALVIQSLCARYRVPFLINDNVMLASEIHADGVHIGQGDMSLKEAREVLGFRKIIGVSVQTVQEAVEAEKNGANYLGVGAVFPTSSKDDAVEVSHETLAAICRAVSIPVVAIGGITKENLVQLKGSGICGIAVISALFAQKDIQMAATALVSTVEDMLHD